MSPKKAQICIDALTQVDVIGLLVGTTGLAGMVADQIGPEILGKSSASKMTIKENIAEPPPLPQWRFVDFWIHLLTDYLTPQALHQHFSHSSTLSDPFFTGLLRLYTTPRVRHGPCTPSILAGLWRVLAIPLDGTRLTAF